jgi:hypothetical protein
MTNKKCRSTEQLLIMVEWNMARTFISAAATEKLEQCKLDVYEDKALTAKGAWGMGLTPLRMSEAPILKILPAAQEHPRSANGGTPSTDPAE